MTAETLKPFITPTSVANGFPAKQLSVTHSKQKARQLIPIVLSIIALVLVGCILILTIWQTMHVQHLDRDLSGLKQEVFLLRQRLGINYLDEMAEFQKEYTNQIIQDPNKLDDIEGEEDEDEEDDDFDNYNEDEDDEDDEDGSSDRAAYDDYLDMIEKEKESTQTTPQNNNGETETDESTSSTSSAASNDDFFGDFTSYNESKKKRARKSRSIAVMRNELQTNDVTQTKNNQSRTDTQQKESGVVSDVAATQPQLRKHHQRSRQGRQRILVRKAKSADLYAGNGHTDSAKPAAHFHLNRKVPHHNAPIQVGSYLGDMYVGHATASSDNPWQQHFSVHNGVLTVNQPGLYYVYAQICYNNTHDENGFIIFHGHNAFLQCLNTVPTNMPHKVHTCHTSGLIQLQKHESIHLRDIHQDRVVTLRDANNRSYFGIIKI
ncbi:protein eiger isoform X2 [Drosophila grimshawi]|uniref:protein eiger isoform X2 n=1 Tax=Drosophila grimshawi TaxID=7222 RepID=UPI000C86ED5A|nr:protein eiger isoform X2 [Drosophila grimshawi]